MFLLLAPISLLYNRTCLPAGRQDPVSSYLFLICLDAGLNPAKQFPLLA